MRIMKFKNLILVGTSHIAPESVKDVEDAIEKYEPGVVAIELDKKRLYGLLHPTKKKLRLRDIKRIGVKGFLFALLGEWAERKLGEQIGTKPGQEMMKAYRLGRKHHAKIALIDQDIEITLKRISQTFTWKEKWNFFVDIIKAVIFRKPVVDMDLKKVPGKDIIAKLMKETKKRYPNLYKVLVVERNHFMAANLARIMTFYPDDNIVAVIGAGHEKEMKDLVKKYLKKAMSG